jgi:serine phosphatase RsbU (regulator of sigma subunit)
LGVSDEADYLQTETHLQTNDRILYFSDALNESRNPDGSQLGMAGLKEIVRNLDSSKPELVIPNVLNALDSLHSANLDEDDLTVMLIEATGTKSTVKDNLLAPFRLLRPPRDATELGG